MLNVEVEQFYMNEMWTLTSLHVSCKLLLVDDDMS